LLTETLFRLTIDIKNMLQASAPDRKIVCTTNFNELTTSKDFEIEMTKPDDESFPEVVEFRVLNSPPVRVCLVNQAQELPATYHIPSGIEEQVPLQFAAGRDMRKTDTRVENAKVETGIFVDDELQETVEVRITC